MSDIVIKAEDLGKKYIIGHQAQRGSYTSLRDVWMQNARTLWNKTKDLATGKPIIQGDTTEEVWALKDVNFEIHRGEAVGIIGRNGAGKSTLLKVLSRITEPSSGRVTIDGRVASLLEVGTGFHPELTGRENIYLNGTILGMTRKEIKRKFDEIVAFAEVEKYLDTPVKRYSSGMYVRLAFAVAAHLEPEILVVDEVLAVGDAAFQKKCMGKMTDVAHAGRTVLFVSHNMSAISQLCQNAFWLDSGLLYRHGKSSDVIDQYLQSSQTQLGKSQGFFQINEKLPFQFKSIRLLSKEGKPSEYFNCDGEMIIELDCILRISGTNFYGYMVISRLDETTVIENDSFDGGLNPFENLKTGEHLIKIVIPPRTLAPGSYNIYFNFTESFTGKNIYSPGHVCSFDVYDVTSRRGNDRRGFSSALLSWDLQSSI